MNSQSVYIKKVQSRGKIHYCLGALARLKRFWYNRYIISLARRKGATIGECVSLPLGLAKNANSNLVVGSHASIQTKSIDLRAPVRIGNNVIIGKGVEIITCSHDVDSPDWEFKSYGIVIEDFVWIATNVLVLPSCRNIGRGAVVGGGSVVAKNVNSMHIVAGNPAVFLRDRKQVHYNLCVEELLGNDFNTYINVRKHKF
jgi:acetyltransferase-like isoleucine patch superfamily enzyme